MHFLIATLCTLTLAISSQGFAQAGSSALITDATSAICVWPVSGLREAPGKQATYIESIKYGERVQVLGELQYVLEEDRMYMKVLSNNGKQGWVHRYLFEENGEVIVLTSSQPIYPEPQTASTPKGETFESGELLVMSDWKDGWVEVTNEKRSKKGWIAWNPDEDVVSVEEEDIMLATMLQRAKTDDASQNELAALRAMRARKGFAASPVHFAVEKRIRSVESSIDTKAANARLASKSPNQPVAQTNIPTRGDTYTPNTAFRSAPEANSPAPAATNLAYREELVEDATGARYTKVTEKGSIYEVRTIENVANKLYAYHKTLPKGTRILLNVPGNPGFVELVVTNKLQQNREQIIALPRAVIDMVYGSGASAKDVEATIVYFVQ